MIVSELITELQKLNPKLQVYVSRDEEGNGFKPLADIEVDEAKNICENRSRGKVAVLWP